MSFLPLPPSFLRQLAEERLPRRSQIRDDPAPVGSRRPPHRDVVELRWSRSWSSARASPSADPSSASGLGVVGHQRGAQEYLAS
jgi:hypothetical protein